MLWIFPTVCLALYFLGVRFVGKPMAVYGWQFWMTKPRMRPSIASYLLYPVVHSLHDGKPLDQDRFFPTWYDDLHMPSPIIVDMHYKVVETRKGYMQQFSHGAVGHGYYIRNTAWLWFPRVVLLIVILHPFALLRHLRAGLRWLVNGGFTKLVVGKTDK